MQQGRLACLEGRGRLPILPRNDSAVGGPSCDVRQFKQNSCMSWMAYTRPNLAVRIAVLCQLAAFVAAVYLVVVVGGGLLIGESERPSVGLSVVATGIVAVAFEPLREFFNRRFALSPYDRLARFVGSAADTVATERIAPELARLVAEGTRAAAAEVWLESTHQDSSRAVVARWPDSWRSSLISGHCSPQCWSVW